MRETLRAEVEGFLRQHGPSTATAVALGVRARREDVERVLAGDGFAPANRPEGASPRGRYFKVSRRVPRADAMLEILRDGEQHSRSEIARHLAEVGASTYTNNAAAELRFKGYDVRTARRGGEVFYWIAGFPTKESAA